jgi:Family of unknown function (DUF6225)
VSADDELPGRPVRPSTADELRTTLKGVPGDLPVRVMITEEPSGDFIGEQVVISAGPWNDQRDGAPPTTSRSAATSRQPVPAALTAAT